MHRQLRTTRASFTLIELIVVVSLMLVLAGMTVLLMPRFQEQHRIAQAASLVQGTLMTAKSRAMRDRVPRGVRLIPGKTNPLWVQELQFIEQPEDYSGGTVETDADFSPGTPPVVRFSADLRGGQTDQTLWPVQPGDFLEIGGGGLMRRIEGITYDGTQSVVTLATLNPEAPIFYKVQKTMNYRIVRAPRVTGEDVVRMPADVAIDLTMPNGNPYKVSVNPQTNAIDILFSPSGAVIGQGAANSRIIFWVRDATLPNVTDGEPSLICIYTRSGALAAHPVDVSNTNNPYSFTEDGLSSGQ